MSCSITPADVREILEGYCLDTTTSLSKSGNTVIGSAVISNIDTTNIKLYMKIAGAGIPAGAIVSEIGPGSQIEISIAATATGTAVAFTLTQYDQVSDLWLTKTRDEMVIPFVEGKVGFSLTGGIGRTTEYCSGTGSSLLILSRRPITEVHSINLITNPSNWIFVSPTAVEVLANEGMLKLKAVLEAWQNFVPAFPRGTTNVKVEYSYGYASIPCDLARVVNNLVASLALGHVAARTGGGNVSVPGIGRTYGPRGKYGDIRTELERWAYSTLKRYMSGMVGS